MPRTHLIAMALAGTALAAVPANAGGLLGGGAANCHCQAASSPTGASSAGKAIGRGNRGASQAAMVSRGQRGSRAMNGNVTSSVNNVVNVTVARSIDRRSGHMGARTGLAGKVSSNTARTVKLNAGRSAGPTGQVVDLSVMNKKGATGRSLANVAVLNGKGGVSGEIVNASVLNRTGTTGRPAVNVAALNGNAGDSGRLANVSVLNGRHGNGNGSLRLPKGVQIINGVPCGPDGRPLTGAAAATVKAMIGGNGGKSGKVVNVSVLNKKGTTGHSAVNVVALNGTGGKSGKVVNVAILNGAKGVPSVGLPSPGCKSNCPSSGNGGGGSGGGTGTGGSPQGGGGAGPAAPDPSPAPTPTGRPIDPADRADHKDLWWPPHPAQQSRDGRLNDH